MLSEHILAWVLFLAFVLVMLAIDLLIMHRKPHEIRMKEAAAGTLLPVGLAIVFMGGVYWAYTHHFLGLGIVDPAKVHPGIPTSGGEAALLFLTGYVVELSLSADNVFLFVVLMTFFKVPRALQHRVLFWGVLGALVMRGAMVLAGVAMLQRFHWVIYIFGAFLVYAGLRMIFSQEEDADPAKSLPVRIVRKLLPIRAGYAGKKFFVRDERGHLVGTTLLLVLVCIEFTDLVFALDSIPAVFGITQDGFIVFTSNVFAILGLRSMYFLLAGVIDKFHYLRVGLAVVLGFVGVKMLLPGLAEGYAWMKGLQEAPHWDIDKYVSLVVIVTVLAVSVAASMLFPRRGGRGVPAST